MGSSYKYDTKLMAGSNTSKKNILLNNFLGGLAWGLGTVVGAGVIVAVVGAILNLVGVLDPMKNFLQQFQAIPQLYR